MAWGENWEKVFSNQNWGKYPPEDLIRFVARNFYKAPDRSKVKLLEVGCGTGANLWFTAREGFGTYGVDGSSTAIKAAEARLNSECPGWKGQLLTGDIERLPFDDEMFDGVFDNEAIYANSFESSVNIYKEMLRVTKKGGKLFTKTFAEGSYGENSGPKAGHNAWYPEVEPFYCGGDCYSRFTSYKEIPDMLPGWTIQSVDMTTYTYGGYEDNRVIKEWVIIAEKP